MQTEFLVGLLSHYRYWILLPLAMVEGPLVALVVGFLVFLGYVSALPAFAIMILGDLVPDSFYYYLGRLGNRKKLIEKYSARWGVISKNFGLVERMWRDHPGKSMWFGKLAYGLSIPFLISAGLVKMSFKQFVFLAIPVTLFQYGLIMTIGYLLGNSYALAEGYIQYAYFFIAFVVIVFIAISYLVSKFARRQIEKLEQEEQRQP